MTAVFVFRESQEITKHWIGTLDGSSKRSLNRRQCCPTAPSQNITHATNSVAIPEALALSKGHIGVCTKNVLYESGGCSQSPSPENRRTRVWMLFITLTTLLGHPCLSNSPSLLGAKVMLVSSITQMLSTWRRSFSLSRRREAMAEVKVVNHDHNSRNLRLLTGFGAPALQSSNWVHKHICLIFCCWMLITRELVLRELRAQSLLPQGISCFLRLMSPSECLDFLSQCFAVVWTWSTGIRCPGALGITWRLTVRISWRVTGRIGWRVTGRIGWGLRWASQLYQRHGPSIGQDCPEQKRYPYPDQHALGLDRRMDYMKVIVSVSQCLCHLGRYQVSLQPNICWKQHPGIIY